MSEGLYHHRVPVYNHCEETSATNCTNLVPHCDYVLSIMSVLFMLFDISSSSSHIGAADGRIWTFSCSRAFVPLPHPSFLFVCLFFVFFNYDALIILIWKYKTWERVNWYRFVICFWTET